MLTLIIIVAPKQKRVDSTINVGEVGHVAVPSASSLQAPKKQRNDKHREQNIGNYSGEL